ncbi:MAG: NUDIX hydrolase, partial [Streptosporangiaceae bacterium]
MAACARRETLEETGLAFDPGRVALDLVFLAAAPVTGDPAPREPGFEARFVPLDGLPGLHVRPPLAGHLRALHAR